MSGYISCHRCNKNGKESYACICGVPEEQVYPHGSIMQAKIAELTAEVERLQSKADAYDSTVVKAEAIQSTNQRLIDAINESLLWSMEATAQKILKQALEGGE